MHEWKVQRWQEYYYSYLADTTTTMTTSQPLHIYESAGGLGLNLLMTVETLLNDVWPSLVATSKKGNNTASPPPPPPPPNIVLYGNEYMADSVEMAHALYQTPGIYPRHDNNTTAISWGTYCPADSRYLDFVPAAQFDIVLTGYITPLQNPLQLSFEGHDDEHDDEHDDDTDQHLDWYQYTLQHLCGHNYTAVAEMQARQEAWYAEWVTAMVRLAKPAVTTGPNIWIEQVSQPLCVTAGKDWGGVSPDFWHRHAPQWGVDSIVMMPDTHFGAGRYHVAMRKT